MELEEQSRSAEGKGDIRELVGEIHRTESRRIFATLIRLVGDFDLAEEVLQEAFAAAVEQWPNEGIPSNPRAWLVSAGRFKAVDIVRRRTRFDATVAEIAKNTKTEGSFDEEIDEASLRDDQLRLIFTCCHPALSASTQVALTLREVCGLTTEEVASAFLASTSTIAQRIVRGKAKIREAKIPYEFPSLSELPGRLDSVLSVVYLVFNEGYSASSGDSATRADLSGEAIRLGRLLVELLPDSETLGLLALMLLHESRREARTNGSGDLVLLEDQDRSLWDAEFIREGTVLVERAMATGNVGVYAIQAAIAAVHADSRSTARTDWGRIVSLYDLLLQAETSPIVELNRAVAVAMSSGLETGLALVEAILQRGELEDYHLAHAARADLCRRLGRVDEARVSYVKALSLVKQEPERRFLERRLRESS